MEAEDKANGSRAIPPHHRRKTERRDLVGLPCRSEDRPTTTALCLGASSERVKVNTLGKCCGEAAGPGSSDGGRGSWPIDAHPRLGIREGKEQGVLWIFQARKSARNPQQQQINGRPATCCHPPTSPLSSGSTETALWRLVRLLGGRPLDRRAASCATTAVTASAHVPDGLSRQAPDAVARGCETCDINKTASSNVRVLYILKLPRREEIPCLCEATCLAGNPTRVEEFSSRRGRKPVADVRRDQ